MATVVDGVVVVYGGPRPRRPRVVTFKADPEEVELMDIAASRLGMSRSELIREAVRRYIEETLRGRG